jgi:hypothetical protein
MRHTAWPEKDFIARKTYSELKLLKLSAIEGSAFRDLDLLSFTLNDGSEGPTYSTSKSSESFSSVYTIPPSKTIRRVEVGIHTYPSVSGDHAEIVSL